MSPQDHAPRKDGIVLAPPENPDVGALQRHASDPHWSVWVGASAGSGKTKVLADRVTRLLLEGVRPEKILCLTFTRAAAAEMSIRITLRLSHWATCPDSELDHDLDALQNKAPETEQRDRARRLFAQVLACPGGMRIQTIHAFAQEILRRFPLEAGLAPQFAVMEEAESKALWRDAMSELLEAAAEGREPAVAAALKTLVHALGEDSLTNLLREVGGQGPRLRATIEQKGGLKALLIAMRRALDLEPEETSATLCRQAVREGGFAREALKNAATVLIEKGTPRYAERAAKIRHWLEQDEEGRIAWLNDYSEAFLTQKNEPFKDLANKELLANTPGLEETLLVEARRLQSVRERFETLNLANETAAILTLGARMIEAYSARKQAQAALDYDDLIAKTNDLLMRPAMAPWVLFKLDGGIDHILVDESQDTNPAQWRIIEALANEYFVGESARSDRLRTLFVVGDEKQSIYSFLKADPEEFARMRALFAERIRAVDAPFDEVPLNISFRSAPAVLRAVDAVFAAETVRAGVSHSPVRHVAFRGEGAGRVEVWPLLVPPEENGKTKTRSKTPEDWVLPLGYENAHNPAAELATTVAEQIKRWVTSGLTVFDRARKAQRPITPGDVMVLVQTRSAFVDHLVRALKKLNVPVSGVDRMRLTDQLAVMDLTALLQFALLPEDDLTLATVLRGPLIGADEDDLMVLAVGRTGSLWQSLNERAVANEEFAVWRDYLAALAALADQMPPLPLLTRVLNEPCPADALGGRRALAARLGPDAEDPIDELLNAAEDFGARHTPSLQAFLHWLMSTEAEVKREMEQAAGRVRITTVHASKGLEAPVVILPDTVRVPQRAKLPKILWDSRSDCPFYVPRDLQNALLRGLRNAARDRQMEEYRRLLYVAMTRAADRLYICGYEPETREASPECWYSLIAGALKHHHEPAPREHHGALTPSVILADYALPATPGEVPAPQVVQETTPPPAWLHQPPPPEPSPPRPLVPSRPSEEDPPSLSPQDQRFARGRLIHRLLQSLPDVAPNERASAAARYLANPQHGLLQPQQQEIAQEVLRLLDEAQFAPLFGPESRAEIPIIGLSGERLIAGQVDRLALVGEEVWVVDFKTNRPPPAEARDIPPAYAHQMAAYKTVLEAVYPGRRVRCFLLWTYAPRLMEILPGA